MVSDNDKLIAKNTIYLYIRMLIVMGVSFYTARIVFNALGVDDYGTYNIVGSIIVLFTFINNGLSIATKRFVTVEIVNGSLKSQQNVFNLSFVAHFIIAGIVFLFAETIGLWCVNCFLKIPEGRIYAANIVYQLSVASTILGILQSPYGSIIIAHERMSSFAFLSIIDVFYKLLIAFIVKWTDHDRLIVYALLLFSIGLLNFMLYSVYCHHNFSMCRFKKPYNKNLLKEVFSYTGWGLMGQCTSMLSIQGVNVLVNYFCGVAVNAAMGISNSITSVVTQFASNFQVAFNPQITKRYVEQNYKELIQLVMNTSRYSALLTLLFLIPIISQTSNILSIWLGNYPLYAVEFCHYTLFCIFIDAIVAPLWMVMYSDKDIKNYQIVISSFTLLNVIGSFIVLYCHYPPYSVMIVKLVTNFIILIARIVLLKGKVCAFPAKKWFHVVFFTSFKVVLFPIVCLFLVSQVTYSNRYVEMAIVLLISFLSTIISVIFGGLNRKERSFVFNKLRI